MTRCDVCGIPRRCDCIAWFWADVQVPDGECLRRLMSVRVCGVACGQRLVMAADGPAAVWRRRPGSRVRFSEVPFPPPYKDFERVVDAIGSREDEMRKLVDELNERSAA